MVLVGRPRRRGAGLVSPHPPLRPFAFHARPTVVLMPRPDCNRREPLPEAREQRFRRAAFAAVRGELTAGKP